jgi:hypothetical protein
MALSAISQERIMSVKWKIAVYRFITYILYIHRPNIVIEWLALFLHIREVLGSNLGPETG